jgi:Transglutaminase-like superfamily
MRHAAAEVRRLSTKAILRQPSIRRSLIWPLTTRLKSRINAASSVGSEPWVFTPRRNSSLSRSTTLVVRRGLPLRLRKREKRQQFGAALLQAAHDARTSLRKEMTVDGPAENRVNPDILLAQQRRGVPGSCRRFAYVYLGSLLSAGLNARVVNWNSSFYDRTSRGGHTLVEVWIEELHTWVLMDAMSDYEFLVDGRLASLIDVREAVVVRGEPHRVAAHHPSLGRVSLELTPEVLHHIYVSRTNAVFDGYSVATLTTKPISFFHYVDQWAAPYPQNYKRVMGLVGAGALLLGGALLGATVPALLNSTITRRAPARTPLTLAPY